MRNWFGFTGKDVSASTVVSSSCRARAPYSVAVWIAPSAAAAASRHVAVCMRSPRIGVAPRAWTVAAPSLLRTSASTWCPPRISESSTAAPTYPVPPVRNTRIFNQTSVPRVFHHNSGHMARPPLLDFFAEVIGDQAAKNAQFLAYDDGYRTWTWTYGELVAAAQCFAGRLRSAGIASGEAIAIWSENRPEWIAALWGALLEGGVFVPIAYRPASAHRPRLHQDRARLHPPRPSDGHHGREAPPPAICPVSPPAENLPPPARPLTPPHHQTTTPTHQPPRRGHRRDHLHVGRHR